MRSYNIAGYTIIFLHILAAGFTAPSDWGFLAGTIIGLLYLLFIWFVGGIYASNILHMGIAHRSMEFKAWFVKSITVFFSVAGIYINPTTWVNRHRHHHAFSDHEGDPNKLADDGFWKTLYLCFFPYKCKRDLARDEILKTPTMRFVSTPYFAVFSQISSYGILLLLFGEWIFALSLWLGVRVFALWVNMIQNYWTHDKRFGTRRYDDSHDNAMNITDWLPVTATFSASLQNNHHHSPRLLRTSHDDSEYDFGFTTVRAMKALGLVEATSSGMKMPKDIPLEEAGF
ncbi:MAG: fatty acid desaturase [Pyrinomonadaceae bacterium]